MPMSEAAMDGIRDNGSGWKFKIRLSDLSQQIGAFPADADDKAVEEVANQLLSRLRNHVKAFPKRAYSTQLESGIEDLFAVADCGIEEVRYALDPIWDLFDYHRVLVL